MAVFSVTPELITNKLPTPDPLMLLFKGGGGGTGKSQSQAPDKRKFLYQQGIDQKEDERFQDARFDIEVNNLVNEAMAQQKEGGMPAKDYLTVGPGAQKFNSFLRDYYQEIDELAMRSQYLQENRKYYELS